MTRNRCSPGAHIRTAWRSSDRRSSRSTVEAAATMNLRPEVVRGRGLRDANPWGLVLVRATFALRRAGAGEARRDVKHTGFVADSHRPRLDLLTLEHFGQADAAHRDHAGG